MYLGKVFGILASLVLTLSLTPARLTLATEFKVGNDSACSLADAIRAANDDQAVGGCSAGDGEDTIILTGDITLTGNLPDIRSKLTVTSDSSGVKHTISGAGRFYIFDIEGGHLTLKTLQLISGRGYDIRGGAVRLLEGYVSLSDVRMEDNWAGRGGGALRVGNGSSASCDMCVFVDNHAPEGGAIWVGDEGTRLSLEEQRRIQQLRRSRRRHVHQAGQRHNRRHVLLQQQRN